MKSHWIRWFHWLPRLAALVIAGGFLALIAGEFIVPHSAPPTRFVEWLGIALVSIGCLSPLLAWRWELEGALLSLASLAAFFALVHFRNYSVLAVMSVPAVLFLADWVLRRTLDRQTQSGSL